ncbi:polyphosphate kinase 1 [Coprococcus comes]|uniref:polyphosphate kinase 1 n=1 Tax=Coprococcus comes TaxID=410072 RepID=UPI0015705173|nr:polyphosphate kinase 1 [Coprococcus comes]NSC13576.1 polyphosphate kinase 1 [Coprococcus comes]NSC16772.1 polyphosphate kinase 1 [Coprococcus comes]NSC29450.1 polyphosphate kinase 1 [Coprococcus comes]NSC66950.1 polyphosphate kinase 1 [Coprococcus comes]NSC85020.1 polyphosphate kinase 1 [Coprococcus comes]
MKKEMQNYTQNRELSWLKFNQRVLEEAKDSSVPLLERMKFVSIFISNLDEFFMIRVGSLYDMSLTDNSTIDSRSGMNPKEQLDAIFAAVAPLYKERDKTYSEIKKLLNPYGVCGLSIKELDQQEKKYVKKYFKDQILPILSPQIVDANHPFPHLLNKELYVIASLKQNGTSMIGIVPVPQFVSDILYLPGHDIRYIRMEKVIMEYLDVVFDKYEVSNKNYICVTRNADVSPDDEALEINDDFRLLMQETLHKRRRMAVVRMETAEPLDKELEKYFCDKFKITPAQIYRTKMPMKLDYIFSIMDKVPASLKRSLIDEPFTPQPSRYLTDGKVIPQVKKKDILLSYPYESMDPFLRMIKEAAYDPTVLTIRITIYRLAKKARLVEYLCAAAENGKEVTVLIELRARFDEQNNIDWSERLEEAGCRVIYGFEGYKVHSKICLITYRNRNNIEYITQVGTGNYNEKTATMYTDVSLITADKGIGEDAAVFFKNMSIGNLNGSYQHIIVSPTSLKPKVLSLMDEEIKKGTNGRIIMKMNSVTDVDFIQKVSEASNAGVRVDLIVRGICCILPGVKGYTENLRVTSIVGRYLEHPRIFLFGTGADQKIYIGSADMMTRNTEKRVEVACPVYDETIRKQLTHMLKIMLADNVKARELKSDGKYYMKEKGTSKVNSQEYFMREAITVRHPEGRTKQSFVDKIRKIFRRK